MLRGLSSGLACLLVIALAPTAAHAQQLLTSPRDFGWRVLARRLLDGSLSTSESSRAVEVAELQHHLGALDSEDSVDLRRRCAAWNATRVEVVVGMSSLVPFGLSSRRR